jgi:hypothetical protein
MIYASPTSATEDTKHAEKFFNTATIVRHIRISIEAFR